MGQIVTQGIQAELIAIVTDSGGNPALGLTSATATSSYRKEGDTSFSAKALADTQATLLSANSEPFTLTDGQTLDVVVDAGAPQTATFNTADFADINNATAAEVAAVIATDITGVTALPESGAVRITSDTAGASSEIQVTGGTANSILGFSTTAQVGYDVFKEIGSGVYTILFFADELDTLGSFTYTVNGAGLQQFVGIVTIADITVPATPATILTCNVTGSIFDLEGNPVEGASVSARVLGSPSIEQNNIAMTSSLVSVKTDSSGVFSLKLTRLADVDIFIPEVNYRRQLKVPNKTTANLFEIA